MRFVLNVKKIIEEVENQKVIIYQCNKLSIMKHTYLINGTHMNTDGKLTGALIVISL